MALANFTKTRRAYNINIDHCVVKFDRRSSRDKMAETISGLLFFGYAHTAISGYEVDGKFVIVNGRSRYYAIQEILNPACDLMTKYGIDRDNPDYAFTRKSLHDTQSVEKMKTLKAEAYVAPKTPEEKAQMIVFEYSSNSGENMKPSDLAAMAKELIEEHGYTQEKAAIALNTSKQNVGQVINAMAAIEDNDEAVGLVIAGDVAISRVTEARQDPEIGSELAAETVIAASKISKAKKEKAISSKSMDEAKQEVKSRKARPQAGVKATSKPADKPAPESRADKSDKKLEIELAKKVRAAFEGCDIIDEDEKTGAVSIEFADKALIDELLYRVSQLLD